MNKVEKDVLDAFEKMWGLFPAPVMLIHATREIVAVNDAAEELNISKGMLCHSLYPSDKPCPGCLANKALKNGKAERRCGKDKRNGYFMDGYWIPVRGEKDLYVHFGVDITEYVKPELLA